MQLAKSFQRCDRRLPLPLPCAHFRHHPLPILPYPLLCSHARHSPPVCDTGPLSQPRAEAAPPALNPSARSVLGRASDDVLRSAKLVSLKGFLSQADDRCGTQPLSRRSQISARVASRYSRSSREGARGRLCARGHEGVPSGDRQARAGGKDDETAGR
ncbi:hypothetical protein BD309DRAFT_969143 [Dichomitus squalens]|uniref:Uncharacterized protein n=1 Tax=Dichomitus squalens TaxID=114155 RepID=A0A4Q9PGS2_9APHY|nr:hypothetical protein BD309DRAFT_969143 [Dichomitus squalens]TBU51776.1 hypothetical protein BD310DRAFT_941616 [Dichomitus squalens]